MGRRFVASTVVGQLLDTMIFATVAFLGAIDAGLWLVLVASNYVYKVGFEIVLLPATLAVAKRLKKAERLDVVDEGVSLNPLGWKVEDLPGPGAR